MRFHFAAIPVHGGADAEQALHGAHSAHEVTSLGFRVLLGALRMSLRRRRRYASARAWRRAQLRRRELVNA